MFEALVKGLILGLLLSVSVGPVIFSILKQSLNNGHRGGYAFIAGVSVSDVLIVIICNMFTRLFDTVLEHELIIGIAGSGLLVALGIYNFFFRKVQVENGMLSTNNLRTHHLAGIFFSGFFMNALNPGALLFWFATTATITADSKLVEHPDQYRFIVFLTTLAFNLAADTTKVLLANKIRLKLTPHNIHIINRISGVILVGFGIAIVVTMLIRNAHAGNL
ncbi:LysE family translocator [Parafilimonas sp.]|jgi:threonine/homoserine/homoserine lactone efflux protein|uniref:LysE family translocator n=1 Tax=Parafilimonas sp. TaxID=1969739 RepID=UPI003F7F827E